LDGGQFLRLYAYQPNTPIQIIPILKEAKAEYAKLQ
jgi:hypothetical protein